MKRWRVWILPILTVLVLLVVTLFPGYLFEIQDQKLLEHVHTEVLAAEINLPAQPPDLLQRTELLSCWKETPDVMYVQNEVVEEAIRKEVWENVIDEVNSFFYENVLPLGLIPDDFSYVNISRIYLRRQLLGAEYFVFDAFDKTEQVVLYVVLDGETKNMLWFELEHPLLEKYNKTISLADVGEYFLARLGIAASVVKENDSVPTFQMPGEKWQYWVHAGGNSLKIFPVVSYPVMDGDPYAVAE